MTTETVNGLHKCQPKNEPKQGEVKNMVVLNMPAKQGKKAWIKIKSEKPEKGGSPYRILNVEKLDWPPDDYGNIAFNLEVEAARQGRDDDTQVLDRSAFQQARSAMQQGESVSSEDDAQNAAAVALRCPHSGPMSKDDYWGRKEDRDEERQKFIIRQHSQSMALEVLKLKVTLNELTVEDLTPAKLTTLANYFDADVYKATE